MKGPTSNWPAMPQETLCISDSEPEIKKTTAVFSIITANSSPFTKLIDHFSSWEKLRRATAWLLKFRSMLLYLSRKRKDAAEAFMKHPKAQEVRDNHTNKIKSQSVVQTLSVEDLALAGEFLIRHIQQQSF